MAAPCREMAQVESTEKNMKQLALVLALTLAALAFQVSTVLADHWCGGAYDEKLGTTFGQCPGPKH